MRIQSACTSTPAGNEDTAPTYHGVRSQSQRSIGVAERAVGSSPMATDRVVSIFLPKNFEKWKVFGTVALSFVYDKYYQIMD